MLEIVTMVINCVLLALIGIIGFFLKRYVSSLDSHIALCNEKHVEIGQLQTEIKNMATLFKVQFENLNETIRLLRTDMQHGQNYRKGHL